MLTKISTEIYVTGYFDRMIKFCRKRVQESQINSDQQKRYKLEIEILMEHKQRMINELAQEESPVDNIRSTDNIIPMKHTYDFLDGFYKGVTHG